MASCLDLVPSTYLDMCLLLTDTPRQLEGSHWGSVEQTSTSVPLQAGSAGNQQPAEYEISLGGIWHDRDRSQGQRKPELQCSSAALRGHDEKKTVTGNKQLYSKEKHPVPHMMSLNQYKDWEDKSETVCPWSTAWIVTQASKAWNRVPATAQQPPTKFFLTRRYYVPMGTHFHGGKHGALGHSSLKTQVCSGKKIHSLHFSHTWGPDGGPASHTEAHEEGRIGPHSPEDHMLPQKPVD